MTYPKVTIVILNWNGLNDTIECLESLKQINYCNYEIIVVDNGSAGNDVKVLEEKYSSYARIIANGQNLGFAGGNNVGIRQALKAGADYVLVLNNDTVVEPVFLSELVAAAEKDSRIGALGPKLYYYDNPAKLQLRQLYGKLGNTAREMETLSGAAFLVRRQALEEVGLLDEVFYPAYCEDRDFFERLKVHGYKILCVPTSKVYHKMSATTNREPDSQSYLIIKYSFLLLRRRRISRSWIASFKLLSVATAFQFAVLLRAAAVRRSLRPILMFFRGIKEGLTIFSQNPEPKW
ncbi:MAG: glycosyltransferase family 2 protein [Nitrososphaerota archaeon]|nr:glycosyltransferase family 2 protein [Nitrososphaerota archaeon]